MQAPKSQLLLVEGLKSMAGTSGAHLASHATGHDKCPSAPLMAGASAGTIHVPVPPTPPPSGAGGLKDVVALLVPFLQPTPQELANNLLFFYVQYHLKLGFSKFVQYTQVWLRPLPPGHLICRLIQGRLPDFLSSRCAAHCWMAYCEVH